MHFCSSLNWKKAWWWKLFSFVRNFSFVCFSFYRNKVVWSLELFGEFNVVQHVQHTFYGNPTTNEKTRFRMPFFQESNKIIIAKITLWFFWNVVISTDRHWWNIALLFKANQQLIGHIKHNSKTIKSKRRREEKRKSKWIYKTLNWRCLAAAASIAVERCCTKFSIHAIITAGNDDLAFTNVYAVCVCVCLLSLFVISKWKIL